MAAPEALEWPRAFPARALRRLGWFLLLGTMLIAITWVLFGTEPQRLPAGEFNPLSALPLVVSAAAAAAVLPVVLALGRRPMVTANHYALTVRPGMGRSMVLPWAGVAEVAGLVVRDEPLLLVRCGGRRSHPGDRPRWFDQAMLRTATRGAGSRRAEVGAFDLAVRMDEFTGPADAKLAALAAWAPPHVLVTDEL